MTVLFEVHIETTVEAYIDIPHWGLFRIWFDAPEGQSS